MYSRDVAAAESVKMEYTKRFSELRAASSRVWLTCKQAVSMVTFFPVVSGLQVAVSLKRQTVLCVVQLAKDGRCYREDSIVTLFPRITDIENFGSVVETLPNSYHASVYNRIGIVMFSGISYCYAYHGACFFPGWMNAVNMFKIARYVDLDLRIDDNRRLTQCIVTLFTGGGGLHLLEQKFRRTYESEFIPGWEIPAMWDAATYTGIH
jgi:hypothetical protein